MRIPRLTPLALVAALALVLGGCVPQDGKATPAPSSSAIPAFATDEEALAAATKAYAAYLAVTDAILMDGGANPDREKEVAVRKQLKDDLAGFAKASKARAHSTGSTKFEKTQLQQYSPARQGKNIVVVYLCEDVSAVDVLDANGVSLVSKSRPNRVSYEVTFDASKREANQLLVADKEPWSGQIC
jgi:hypothetical protein